MCMLTGLSYGKIAKVIFQRNEASIKEANKIGTKKFEWQQNCHLFMNYY